jgi:serine/threonine protein kinase
VSGPATSPPPGPPGASDAPIPPRPAAPHPGLVLAGRYALRRLIATGGMAEVWEGVDHVLERPVALKLLHAHLSSDQAFTARFRAEAIAAARLRHPSIVAIYDTCHDQGHEAIVMELIRGRTVREFLDEHGPLDPDDAIHLGTQVADALSVAHRAGVIHRDIKPANILLCDDERVMVTDFGIAKVYGGSDLTSTGTMLGTVKYLAPEQVAGRPVDPRSDLYSLGVVLYECLTGRPPFTGDTAAAVALARLHQPVLPARALRPELPERLDRVLLRVLAREPDDRYPDAPAFRAALLAAGAPPRPSPTPTLEGDQTAITARPADLDPTSVSPVAGAVPGTASAAFSPHQGPPSPARRSRGRWVLAAILLGVAATSMAVAGVLVSRTRGNETLIPRSGLSGGAPTTIPISSVQPFDPAGDGQENGAQANLAADGDPSTSWRTETYQGRHFGNLKDGVGLVVALPAPARLGRLEVRSPTSGWAASVYVAATPPPDLAGWGPPVDGSEGIQGDATFDLRGTSGAFVLLWITDLGDGPGRVEVEELAVIGR